MKLQIIPRGTRKGLVHFHLATKDGQRLEVVEHWIYGDRGEKGTQRYVTSDGRSYWLDRQVVAWLNDQARGKRKPFMVEVKDGSPPPVGAICSGRIRYHEVPSTRGEAE